MDERIIKQLVSKSREALKNAYCPYSQFPVGAALLCNDESIYLGCNVENAAYSMAICAERTAMVKAISEGHRQFKAIAVTANMTDTFCSPCGNCRQFMAEFNKNLIVILVKPNLTYTITNLNVLLPMAFGPEDLLASEKIPYQNNNNN